MIDCDQSNNGCEGGYRPNAFRFCPRTFTLITPLSGTAMSATTVSSRRVPIRYVQANFNLFAHLLILISSDHFSIFAPLQYRGGDGNCELSPGPVDPTQRVFVDEVRSLPSEEDQIADFIVEKGPVSFGTLIRERNLDKA